jgi:hypothetical protein
MKLPDSASAALVSPCRPPSTPPPSPTLLHLKQNVTVELLQKTFVESIRAVQKSADLAECSNPLISPSETTEGPKQRASKLELKSILEVCVFLKFLYRR